MFTLSVVRAQRCVKTLTDFAWSTFTAASERQVNYSKTEGTFA